MIILTIWWKSGEMEQISLHPDAENVPATKEEWLAARDELLEVVKQGLRSPESGSILTVNETRVLRVNDIRSVQVEVEGV